METREDGTVVDLGELEQRLERRACWFEDPQAYRAGVRDAVRALRERPGDERPDSALAG